MSEIVHLKNYQKQCSTTALYCCGHQLAYTDKYKYSGYKLEECLKEKTYAASRSFGRRVNQFKPLKNMGINTYKTLVKSYVFPIMH